METLPNIDKQEKLMLELDMRLHYLYGIVEEREGRRAERDEMAMMRMAYAQGYIDALKEDTPAQLLEDAPGYQIKGRRR